MYLKKQPWVTENQQDFKSGLIPRVWLDKSITQKSNLRENNIEKSTNEKLLGVNVVYNLKFNEHLESILKKSSLKSKCSPENTALQKF